MHQTQRYHLDGGITEDIKWQARWKKLICIPTERYDVPSGKFGKICMRIMSVELDEVCARKWNAERVIVFQSVIQQIAQGVNNSAKIESAYCFDLIAGIVGRLTVSWTTCKILLWDPLENLAGIKQRSNFIELSRTSS